MLQYIISSEKGSFELVLTEGDNQYRYRIPEEIAETLKEHLREIIVKTLETFLKETNSVNKRFKDS